MVENDFFSFSSSELLSNLGFELATPKPASVSNTSLQSSKSTKQSSTSTLKTTRKRAKDSEATKKNQQSTTTQSSLKSNSLKFSTSSTSSLQFFQVFEHNPTLIKAIIQEVNKKNDLLPTTTLSTELKEARSNWEKSHTNPRNIEPINLDDVFVQVVVDMIEKNLSKISFSLSSYSRDLCVYLSSSSFYSTIPSWNSDIPSFAPGENGNNDTNKKSYSHVEIVLGILSILLETSISLEFLGWKSSTLLKPFDYTFFETTQSHLEVSRGFTIKLLPLLSTITPPPTITPTTTPTITSMISLIYLDQSVYSGSLAEIDLKYFMHSFQKNWDETPLGFYEENDVFTSFSEHVLKRWETAYHLCQVANMMVFYGEHEQDFLPTMDCYNHNVPLSYFERLEACLYQNMPSIQNLFPESEFCFTLRGDRFFYRLQYLPTFSPTLSVNKDWFRSLINHLYKKTDMQSSQYCSNATKELSSLFFVLKNGLLQTSLSTPFVLTTTTSLSYADLTKVMFRSFDAVYVATRAEEGDNTPRLKQYETLFSKLLSSFKKEIKMKK